MPAITIDASALNSVDWSTFIANFISGQGTGSYKFYGGGLSSAYGGQHAMSGDQLAFAYAGSTHRVMLEGSSLAYDSIVYGSSYGHGLSGTLDKVVFGQWVDGVTTGTPGIGPEGLVTGLQQDLVISGLDLTVAVGSGTAGNTLNALYSQIPAGNATALNTLLSGYSQNFIGTAGDDVYTGTAQDDTITGGGGNDTIDGGDGTDVVVFDGVFGAGGTYSFVPGAGGIITLTDSRTTGGTGVDVLSNVEVLKFNNLTYNLSTHQANYAPTDIVFDDSAADGLHAKAALGTSVAEFTVTDADTAETFTYELLDNADGQFVLDGASVKVAGPLSAGSHTITLRATDSAGQSVERQLTIDVAQPSITLDASTATSGIDLETFLRGGFVADAEGSGFPKFDNGSTFAGDEMFIGYGDTASSKYVLARGDIAYDFSSHLVGGEINSIEFGTRGTGSFDGAGAFTGGAAALRISGLNFLNRGATTAENRESGEVHNFSSAFMAGAGGAATRFNLFADHLDGYAQNFIGSAFADVYVGTAFNDTVAGGAGNDTIIGGGGNDQINGGDGVDVVIYDGNYGGPGSSYSYATGEGGALIVTDSRATGGQGVDTLTNVEFIRWDNLTYDAVNHRVNYVPTDVALADDTPIAGSSAVGSVVASLVVTDKMNGGVGGPSSDVHTLSLVNDAGGHFTIDGTSIKVAGLLTAESYTIRVRVVDGAGHVIEKDITIDINEPAVNQAPTALSLSKASILENNAANAVVGVVSATDPEGEAITYALTDTAGGRFGLVTSGGQTRLVALKPLDREAAAQHNVTLSATDASGNVTRKTFTIAVGDVNEAPVIRSNGGGATAAVSVAENTRAVTVAQASDPEGKAVKWAISGGADRGLFTINAATGALSFVSAPDFEAPRDAGRDNVYDVVIRATDAGGLSDSQAIKVKVTDVAGLRLTGTAAAERLNGTAENDTLDGGKGADTLAGGKGNDTYIVDNAADRVVELAGGGTDLVRASVNHKLASQVENLILTGKANLTGEGNGLNNTLTGNAGNNVLKGGVGADTLKGGAGNDRLQGDKGADLLQGGAGADTLVGGAGNDRLQGGKGADLLSGGAGKDTFVFVSLSDSTSRASGRDTVKDFNGKAGDRVDLSGIDANSKKAGDQAFDFIGSKGFSKTAGELRFAKTADGDGLLSGDVNGDGKADFAVLFTDTTSIKADFFLL